MDKDYGVIKNMDVRTNASKNEGFGNLAGAAMFIKNELNNGSEQTKGEITPKEGNRGFEKLKELKAMQEAGLITEDEYNEYKAAILKQYMGG